MYRRRYPTNSDPLHDWLREYLRNALALLPYFPGAPGGVTGDSITVTPLTPNLVEISVTYPDTGRTRRFQLRLASVREHPNGRR
jgi:hypothetical protein